MTDLPVGNCLGGQGDQWHVLPHDGTAQDFGVCDRGTDHDRLAVLANSPHFRDSTDIDERGGIGEPQPEQRQQALTAGQHLRVLTVVTQGTDCFIHGGDAHVALGHAFPGPGTWARYHRAELHVPNARRVLLTTPNTRKAPMVQQLPAKRTCLLTGWALHPGAWNIYKDVDLVLPLSDHADFDELVRMATESGAHKIYTVHGTPKFAEHLRALGSDAEHLVDHPQE